METFRKEVSRMHNSAIALTGEVREIQKTLNQIKYYALGLATYLVINELGITTVLKGLI